MSEERKDVNLKKFKEIYSKVNHNKYSQIINIKGKTELKSNCKNFLYNYKFTIIIVVLVLMILLIYTFRNTPIAILYSVGFLLALFLLALYTSSYRITLDENELNLYINFQKTTINTNNLANIYLSKEKMHFFGFPVYNYMLNIIYIFNENPMIITLPTVMVDRKKLVKLFSNIETQKIKDEEEEIKAKEKNNKLIIRTIIIVSVIFILLAIIITGIIYTVNK